MSEVLSFGQYKIQMFQNGAHVQWRLWNSRRDILARGSAITKAACRRRWQPILDKLLANESVRPREMNFS